jgi:hypothetical protein
MRVQLYHDSQLLMDLFLDESTVFQLSQLSYKYASDVRFSRLNQFEIALPSITTNHFDVVVTFS